MKIVYLSAFAGLGGAERCLMDFIDALQLKRGDWEACVVIPGEGELSRQLTTRGVKVRVCEAPAAFSSFGDSGLKALDALSRLQRMARQGAAAAVPFIGYVKRLGRLLQEESPDIVHSNGMKAHLLAALCAPGGADVVWHAHDYVATRPLVSKALRLVSGRASLIVANSRSVAADVASVLPTRPVVTLHNSVDSRQFEPQGESVDLDAACGMTPASGGTVRIGLVATFARWKGHRVFLEAASLLIRRDRSVPVRFYVIGGPVYETTGSQWSLQELRDHTEALGLSSHVGFAGFHPNIAAAYRALDVVVHASTEAEPFGRTIVEAMSCRRAVVVADAGGASELFEHDATAIGVTPGSAEELCDALERLVGDSPLRVRLAQRAQQHVRESFSLEQFSSELVRLYEQVRNGRG